MSRAQSDADQPSGYDTPPPGQPKLGDPDWVPGTKHGQTEGRTS